MPWTPHDAIRKSRRAHTHKTEELWANVANDVLHRTGDEGRAVREANGVVRRTTLPRKGKR